MKLTARQLRDVFAGLNLLAQEPIANHVLNFRITTNLLAIKPLVEETSKAEYAILLEHAEIAEDGQVKRSEEGAPVWPSRDAEERAVEVLRPLMNEEFDIPAVKPLTWALLEKSNCSYTRKDGGKEIHPLVVSIQVQVLLQGFITGEPTDDTEVRPQLPAADAGAR